MDDVNRQATTNKQQIEAQLSWLDEIEALDTQQAKLNMLKSLRTINGAVLSTVYRHQLMLKLYRQCLFLINASESREGIRDSASAKLTRYLLQESIVGHNIIISEFMASDAPLLQQELLTQSICHTLKLESYYLMEHYLSYEPLSNDIWGKIRLLYRYAQQLKLTKIPLYDKTGAVLTVEKAFISVLLFAAINPFRLKLNEILSSYLILSEWADRCHFELCDDDWCSDGEWVVNLNLDRPPEYLQPNQRPENASELLRINIDSILEAELGQERPDVAHGELKQLLLERLRNGWLTTPPRSYERRNNSQDMEVSIGLKNCHQLLIDDEVQLPGEGGGTWSLHRANQWLEAEVEPQERIISKIKQIDVGMGGYGLSCPQKYSEKIQKGALLLIRNVSASEKLWSVGQVCWKQLYESDANVVFGVVLLAKDAVPLIITHSEVKSNGGLLLPRGDFAHPLATVLLSDEYQEGDLLQCITADEEVKVELTKSERQGGGFQQFSYRILG